MDRQIIFILIISIIGIFILGWISNNLYRVQINQKQIEGLWFSNYNYSNAINYAENIDSSGEWVCINVDKNMDYNDCISTASHECGHELFARKCENDPKICFKLTEQLKNKS
ncbi:Uncharacterised protein [uncultured archaeon]|nr:Uncharacterised protein [uncultured archaeon]